MELRQFHRQYESTRQVLCKVVLKEVGPQILSKKRLWHSNFPMNFAEFHRTVLSKNICELLLLIISPAFFKGNAQFIFLCNTQKSSANACLIRILKSTVTEEVIVCFYNLRWGKFLIKVAAFVIFPTTAMVLFEISQGFKGHFLNELRVFFKVHSSRQKPFAKYQEYLSFFH